MTHATEGKESSGHKRDKGNTIDNTAGIHAAVASMLGSIDSSHKVRRLHGARW